MDRAFDKTVLAGYQGWFATPRNPFLRRWAHWSRVDAPRPGNTAFELYPDVREYPQTSLSRTGYQNLGTGEVSRLYDSDHEGVVNLHFRWMQEHGLHGVSLQRFVVTTRGNQGRRGNSLTQRIERASERLNRNFYIMYDISGHDGVNLVDEILRDVREDLKRELDVFDSPAYARQGDRPVVGLWGFGFLRRPGSPSDLRRLIRELQETHGCYVVGGIPYTWRDDDTPEKREWLQSYRKLDMIIPWSVGRYRTPREVREPLRDHLASRQSVL